MGSAAGRRLAFGACVVFMLVAGTPAQATFPGANGWITHAQVEGSGDQEPVIESSKLAAVSPDGRRDRVLQECELTDGVPSGGDCTVTMHGDPSYSPDGRRIVFDAGRQLAVIDSDGGGLTLLPAQTDDDGSPAFAPDGRRIVFTGSNDRGTTDLYVRRLGGGSRLVVQDAGEPAWSSRGILAYVRSGNVYVARPGGRHRRFVTSGVSPDWSPSGLRLVLIRPLPSLVFDAPIGRMYVVRPDGRGLRQVRGVGNTVLNPVWSPDGRSVAYDVLEAGVYAKRLGRRYRARELAPTQFGSEGAVVASFEPAWRPAP
jgi:Tol biopolymer transport system component